MNINESTKLELGSTAKLRTLVNYLEIVEQLHEQYAHVPALELSALTPSPEDRLTRWAISYLLIIRLLQQSARCCAETKSAPLELAVCLSNRIIRSYLSTARDRSLEPMLEAALEREYSASPAEGFFTAGGLHHFKNFESSDDHRSVTVREAFARSVNLVFIRLMRDIERYYMCRSGGASADVLLNGSSRERHQYLVRFADEEGRVFLRRFYRKYAGVTPAEALDELARGRNWSPVRLAVVYRSVRPEATVAEFTTFLHAHLRVPVQSNQFAALYQQYGSDKFNLADRGYLARVHPLELWLIWYLTEHPRATFAEVVSASADERQQSYAWLFRTHHKKAQNLRIRILMEEDAFKEIWHEWNRAGYPFERLVPSYATAIGVSGDTPAALAELLGIIVNGGMRYPHSAIEQLRFAENTPMETVLRRQPGKGQRVLSAEVAALVRRELIQVVINGTARRACCGFARGDGSIVPLGGKTGTGDNRIKTFTSGGRLVGSRVANRTAVFAFIIGDRFFGTVIVFVPGDAARNYEFSSSLPVQVFKDFGADVEAVVGTVKVFDCKGSFLRSFSRRRCDDSRLTNWATNVKKFHLRFMARFELKSYVVILAVLLCPQAMYAQQPPPAEEAQALVREVVRNELQAQQADQTRWRYVSREQQRGIDQTKEVIETSEGALSRIVAEDNQTLTSQQQRREDQRLQQLIRNPTDLRRQKQEQERDEEKEQQLLAMMPDGFLYEYEWSDGRSVGLSFRPNPAFSPPTREAAVFHAMEGTMIVDELSKRLKELRGRLVRDVVFGWGILGRLHKGGVFEVHQDEVAAGHWELTLVDVHITGKVLFFKTISEQQHEERGAFHRVPGNLDLAQAVEMLKQN